MNKLFHFSRIIFLCAVISGCATGEKKGSVSALKFAVIGNTMSESPFSGESDRLPEVISLLNRENPLFVIHTGNLIHGGRSWMGIKQADIERQYSAAKTLFSRLSSNLYTVLGEKDLYDEDPVSYTGFSGRKPNYGFNLPGIRFLVFNTIKCRTDSGDNFSWLESELKLAKESAPVVVLTHMPVFRDADRRGDYAGRMRFHEIISKYNVMAVISGGHSDAKSFSVENVKYFIAPCGGYSRGSATWKSVSYYLFEISEDIITFTAAKPQK